MSRDHGFKTSCRKGAVLCFISLLNFFKKDLFIYFWLFWVFVVVHGLSLVAVNGGYSLLQHADFSLQ